MAMIETLEWVKDDNGGHFKHYYREDDWERHPEREHVVCTICMIKSYPKCMELCDKWKTSRKSRA